jgi:hypothetical protein
MITDGAMNGSAGGLLRCQRSKSAGSAALVGQQRRWNHPAATSAITLNADISPLQYLTLAGVILSHR